MLNVNSLYLNTYNEEAHLRRRNKLPDEKKDPQKKFYAAYVALSILNFLILSYSQVLNTRERGEGARKTLFMGF